MSDHPDPRHLDPQAELSAEEREALLGHLRTCAACRERVAAADPSRLFGMLALQPVSRDDLDRLSASIETALDAAPPRREAGWGRRLMPLAASLLLAGLVGGYLWTQRGPAPAPPVVGFALPVDRPSIEVEGSAQVLDLVVGDTQVVMIFDEALDL